MVFHEDFAKTLAEDGHRLITASVTYLGSGITDRLSDLVSTLRTDMACTPSSTDAAIRMMKLTHNHTKMPISQLSRSFKVRIFLDTVLDLSNGFVGHLSLK